MSDDNFYLFIILQHLKIEKPQKHSSWVWLRLTSYSVNTLTAWLKPETTVSAIYART